MYLIIIPFVILFTWQLALWANLKTKVQLNEYEKAPYFIQLSQNMTSDCLLICVFTCFYQFLHDVTMKLFCFDLENSFMITSCKNREINKQSDVKFWLNWRKYGTVSYSFSCTFLIYLTVKLRVLIRLIYKHMQAFIHCL